MSSYRRFVSYMHQYKNGKKGDGCGFVKIELKNDTCSFLFQLKELPSSDTLTLAFFLTDRDSVTFLPIWSGRCLNGICNKRLTTDSLHLFNTNYAFRQCQGIILAIKEDIICGCRWDDQAKIPRRFLLAASDSAEISSDNDNDVLDNHISTHSKENISHNSSNQVQEEPTHTSASPISTPHEEIPQTTTIPFEELWKQMQEKYPPLDPFEEGGVVEGIKISPADLPIIEHLPLNLSSNRFLLHGYKTYKHLLLGRMEGQKRYILGIPGIYDSQEEFMAKMFGFPCFKPIRSCQKPIGQFGYWFRCIRA